MSYYGSKKRWSTGDSSYDSKKRKHNNYRRYSSSDDANFRSPYHYNSSGTYLNSFKPTCDKSRGFISSSSIDSNNESSPSMEGLEASMLLSPESPPPTIVTDYSAGSISPETTPLIPQVPLTLQCLLCGSSSPPFKGETEFLIHLTIIHYKERLMKRVKPPYKCLQCSYVPSTKDDPDDLLLHYGCVEKLALQYYKRETCEIAEQVHNESSNIEKDSHLSITCRICNSSFDNERLFVRHISLRHFTKELCSELPKKAPFICPFVECSKQKSGQHSLMLHYGCEHNISMELYLKHKGDVQDTLSIHTDLPKKNPLPVPAETTEFVTPVPKQKKKSSNSLVCKKCTKKTSFVTQKSLNYHLMVTHFFPDLPKIGPYSCPKCKDEYSEKTEFSKHFLKFHLKEYIDGQENINNAPSAENQSRIRTMTTTHTIQKTEARRKVVQSWQQNSVDAQQTKIFELEAEIIRLKEVNDETIRKKGEDFEKWINQKEKLLEEGIERQKDTEEALERSQMDIIDLKKRLQQSQAAHKSVEDMLVEKHSLNHSLIKETKVLEKKVAHSTKESESNLSLYNSAQKSLKDLKVLYDKRGAELEDTQNSLQDKEEEMNDLIADRAKEVSSLKSTVLKNEKSLEALRGKLKSACEEKKQRTANQKEVSKRHKDLEMELRGQIKELTKSNKKYEVGLESIKMEKSEVQKNDRKKMEDLERRNKEDLETIEDLETQKYNLIESLDKLQKVIRDYETVVQEKNEKLQEDKIKLEELETKLKESEGKTVAAKTSEKEKRELVRQVKQLQTTLKDWESRQFANASLIASLKKDKSDADKKAFAVEEVNSGLEEDLDQAKALLATKKSEISKLLEKTQTLESLNAQVQTQLSSRVDEVSSLSSKVSEKDNKIKEYEKLLRSGALSVESNSTLENKNLEIRHLRVNLMTLKTSVSDLKSENAYLKEELKKLKYSNSDFEMEFSQKVAECENLKAKKVTNPIPGLLKIKDEPLDVSNPTSATVINASEPSIVLSGLEVKNEIEESLEPLSPIDPEVNLNIYDFDVEKSTDTSRPTSTVLTTFNPVLEIEPAPSKLINPIFATKAMVDVSGLLNEAEDDVVCGICFQYDPPLPEDAPRCESYKTEWVGCDCDQWYHKICTKLSKFSTRFSCKSVKKKCNKKSKKVIS